MGKELSLTTGDAPVPEAFKLTVDGVEWTGVLPKDSTSAMLALSSQRDHVEMGVEVERFMEAVLDPVTLRMYQKRMRDPRDGFGYEHALAVIQWIVEQATDRPTGLPSGS